MHLFLNYFYLSYSLFRRYGRVFINTKALSYSSALSNYILLCFLIIGVSCSNKSGEIDFKDGDIIFQTSKSSQSKAIQLATKSKYSHMGIIYRNKDKFYVYEAVQPVKLTPLKDWIKRGENQHYVVKRLKNRDAVLNPEKLILMKKLGKKYLGKNYDIYFEWSDKRLYCSELVWKIYKDALNIEIGTLEKLKDFDLSNEIVREKLKERYGNKIPLNERVISPEAIFRSDKLITVGSN
jgi:hypothetical protein